MNKIVFYDGDCGFCNRTVSYVLRNDQTKEIFFLKLQSEQSKQLFRQNKWSQPNLSTFYFFENGNLHEKSTGAFAVMRYFPWYKRGVRIFRLLPTKLTDWVYDFIAKRRSKIFKDYCIVPSKEELARFPDLQG